jgi:hypothetical protein
MEGGVFALSYQCICVRCGCATDNFADRRGAAAQLDQFFVHQGDFVRQGLVFHFLRF